LLLVTDIHAVFLTPHWLLNFSYIAILASVVAYFIPIVATLWGLSDNEHMASTMFISVLIILAGVYLINRQRATRKK
jgi:drug/metabolite transporter (DMT)-like permease